MQVKKRASYVWVVQDCGSQSTEMRLVGILFGNLLRKNRSLCKTYVFTLVWPMGKIASNAPTKGSVVVFLLQIQTLLTFRAEWIDF